MPPTSANPEIVSQQKPSQQAPEENFCFTLNKLDSSTSEQRVFVEQRPVDEDEVNNDLLEQGPFCLNHTTGVIQDSNRFDCIFNDSTQRFQCSDELSGESKFRLESRQHPDGALDAVLAKVSQDDKVTQDQMPPWCRRFPWRCPKPTKSNIIALPLILNPSPPRYDSKEASYFKGCKRCTRLRGCMKNPHPSKHQYWRYPQRCGDKWGASFLIGMGRNGKDAKDQSVLEDAIVDSTLDPLPGWPEKASQTCNISPGAASLLPSWVVSGASVDLQPNFDGNVSISSTESTFFEFQIPPTFLAKSGKHSSQDRLCALQFRLPVCADLPKKYPCFEWSGMEQQYTSKSGMEWRKFFDTIEDKSWLNDEFVQVTPGAPVTVSLFKCGVDQTLEPRTIGWEAKGVNGWSIYFAQAGIGRQARWRDGVGAFIVACD